MRRILAAIETVAALSLLIVALVTSVNVTLRDLFSVQIPDWFDGSKLLMAIALFWGVAIATYHAGHICVDVLWEHLGPPARRVLDIVASAITLAFLAPMAWMVWSKVLASGTQATTDLRLPLVWFTSIAAAGAVAAVLLATLRLVELVRTRAGGDSGRRHGP
ncbi:MAG: TRAP transporter small permease [Piscinibacter sp.]|nr:TRAP transporter small permease [Piscinibacter sp.]